MDFPDVRPKLGEYELVGDSLFVRFALHCRLGPPGVHRARRLGLCISGATVETLCKEVLRCGLVSKKVLVLIGTNDVRTALTASRKQFLRIRGHFDHLRKTLIRRCSEVVFLTIPPIPNLEDVDQGYVTRLERINRLLKGWEDDCVRVLPLCEVLTLPTGLADRALYEEFYSRRLPGGRQRRDGIHLNSWGNGVLQEFLHAVLLGPSGNEQ